jgi:putative ABC transport system ATP-binding protein
VSWFTGDVGSESISILAASGCLDAPTSGRYRLEREDNSGLTAGALAAIRNRRIASVFQQFNLLPRTSALENVELPLVYAGMPTATRHAKAREQLEAVDLSSREHHHPAQFSGRQQRVAIARAGGPLARAGRAATTRRALQRSRSHRPCVRLTQSLAERRTPRP